MARKKKETEKEYDILIGYVRTFDFEEPLDRARLSGHPKIGGIYRLLKDPQGWRLHIGRENNAEGMDGLYLGELSIYNKDKDVIKGTFGRYSFEIMVLNTNNYLDFELSMEDHKQLIEWLDTDNADLWERLEKEKRGEATVTRRPGDLIAKLLAGQLVQAQKGIEEIKPALLEPQDASDFEKVRALEATLTFLTHFKKMPVVDLLALYDGIHPRIIKSLGS